MRVFFALWPDVAVRESLLGIAADCHARCAGRGMRGDTLHMTLAFIGEMAAAQLPEVKAVAGALYVPPFTLTLDRVACWRHNRITHLYPGEAPVTLLHLVAALEAGLKHAGIPFDRRPYQPHVTLLRQADCSAALPQIRPLRWPVSDFVLVQSVSCAQGARYEVLGRWGGPVTASGGGKPGGEVERS